MSRYPYLFLTIFLIFFLGFPFVLKLRNSGLEIYPAIIFPSGAGLAGNHVEILTINSNDFYGVRNEIEELDKRQFFKGIPAHYIPYIHAGDFGLSKYIGESKIYTPPVTFQVRNDFTKASFEETKRWFRERLREQGMKDSLFFVRTYQIEYNVETGRVKSKKMIDEKVYRVR